jgi:hypothetical protein
MPPLPHLPRPPWAWLCPFGAAAVGDWEYSEACPSASKHEVAKMQSGKAMVRDLIFGRTFPGLVYKTYIKKIWTTVQIPFLRENLDRTDSAIAVSAFARKAVPQRLEFPEAQQTRRPR